MKIKCNERVKADGLRQISRYTDQLGQQHGYLVLFEPKSSEQVSWEERLRWADEATEDGKRVTVVEL